MFSFWLNQVGGKLKRQLLAGATTFCWAIWLSRNDVVFDKSLIKSFMHVLYMGTHWLWFWSQYESDDQDKERITMVRQRREMMVMQIFVNHGWRWSHRICA
jgi:hypothetical protein